MNFATQETVEIYRKSNKHRDEFGQELFDWECLGEVFADIRFNSGKEQVKAAIVAEVYLSVRVLWDDLTETVSADDCLKWNGKMLEITAVLPDIQRHEFIDFACREGVVNLENKYG